MATIQFKRGLEANLPASALAGEPLFTTDTHRFYIGTGSGKVEIGGGSSTDEKAKVSSNDTTAGYLNGKLVAGANVTLTENNDGMNETLTIAATVSAADEKTKVSSNDSTAGYLNGKLVAGSGITLTENNDGMNETLTIAASGSSADEKVKVSSNDSTAGYLNGKLVAGTGITLTEGNDGMNETLTIAASSSGGITSLNGLTASTQTFSRVNDANVQLTISSTMSDHQFQLAWLGQLSLTRGGTGASLSGTGPGVLRQTSGGANVTVGQALDYIVLRDEKAAGTDGGTFTSGAWQTRTLNTEAVDTGNHCSLASNQFTLSAGTYRIRARCPAYRVLQHQCKLRNVTDGADTLIGTSTYAEQTNGNVMNHSFIEGRITLTAQKTFEVQHRCASTISTQGFGVAANLGVTEVYTVVELWREVG